MCIYCSGGFGLMPQCEAQGGATYCAVASLMLCNQLHQTLTPSETQQLTYWCINR